MRFVFFLMLATTLNAAPRLRLLQTVLSVSVVPGNNGPSQTVDALNSGDGQLHLQATSSAPWLVPSVGQSAFCGGLIGPCIPIQIALQTSPLAKGAYTGTVTISDPNAIDAPQFVTVTVAVGGSVPDKLEFYAPVTGVSGFSASFTTVSPVSAAVSSNSPGLVALTFVGGAPGVLVILTV
jgi:hypothetical protein